MILGDKIQGIDCPSLKNKLYKSSEENGFSRAFLDDSIYNNLEESLRISLRASLWLMLYDNIRRSFR